MQNNKLNKIIKELKTIESKTKYETLKFTKNWIFQGGEPLPRNFKLC